MNHSREAGRDGLDHEGGEPHLIQEIVCTYQALAAEMTRRTGMKSSRFALMRLLADADADVGIMELARLLGVNAAAVTRQVQELESERLVRRRADPDDGRRTCIRLSPKGRKLMDELLQYSHEFELSLSSALSTEEMVNAATALNKLRSFLDGLR
ncbi:MAG: MarR family transcriptional regulator [Actinobacteria bacterium]|nr:MarR family transcriptional regulator [Actinomycetota bacterium]